ncbi:MAG: PQQ-binding-like beta-propeller repeat protein [Caldisericia bacterium]|nr:PQQ-binding-like beta-propeller repeat protein [Caldisericia bacterium]
MKKRIHSILLATLVAIVCIYPLPATYSSPSANEDITYTSWPLIRVDSNNSGFTSATFPTTMEFDEFLPVHSFHAPIIANNCYFLIEWETGELQCYDIEAQELLWRKRYTNIIRQQDMNMGNVCAFSEETNQLLLLETVEGNWINKTGFVSRVYSLSPKNGNIIWQNDIEGYYANSITLSDTEAYIKVIEIKRSSTSNYLSKNHKIACYNLQTGRKKWITREIRCGGNFRYPNPPALHSRHLVTSSTDCISQEPNGDVWVKSPSYISLIDRDTGDLLQTEVLEDFAVASTPMLVGYRVAMVGSRSGSTALYLIEYTITDGRMVYKTLLRLSDNTLLYYFSVNLSRHANHIYFLDYSGILVCVSIDTSTIKWKKNVGSGSWVGPYFCNEDYLILCTKKYEHITLQYLDPEDGTELFSTSARFDGKAPVELTGTDNHIWAKCGGRYGTQIAHFTTPPSPSIIVSPLEIHETCWEDETECFNHTLTVTSQGAISGTIECSDPWISVDTNKVRKRTKEVTLKIDPTDESLKAQNSSVESSVNSDGTLSPYIGHHTSSVEFVTNGGDVTVSVILDILKRPKLEVIPPLVELTIIEGDTPPFTLFHVNNTGGKGLKGNISEETEWLTLSEHVITDELGEFSALYATQSKPPGIYKSNIEVTSNGGNQTIPITLTITPKPFLVVTPGSIIKQVAIGSSDSVPLTLTNTGGLGLFGTITSDKEWLHNSINIYKDETKTMFVVLNARDLKAGTYYGTITFKGNDQIIKVPVTLQCIVWITFHIGSRTVEVNKVKETIEAAPYLFQKRSYVPVRKLVESLPVLNYLKNAEMEWNPEERKVTIIVNNQTTELWVDNPIAKINNIETPIDPDNLNIAPQIRKGRTFLPLRFVSETLGYTVEWVASTQTIHIKYVVE